jgi:hypothetical protein
MKRAKKHIGVPEWGLRFFGQLAEFPAAKKAIDNLGKRLVVVSFTTWAYTGKIELGNAFAEATQPPGGTRAFARNLQNLASALESFNLGAGKSQLQGLDAVCLALPRLAGTARTFRLLPFFLRAYATWVEASTQYWGAILADKRRAQSRLLAVLAYEFSTKAGIDFRTMAAVLEAGYWAHGIEKHRQHIALAVRNRLARLQKAYPSDYKRFFADGAKLDESLKQFPLMRLAWFDTDPPA